MVKTNIITSVQKQTLSFVNHRIKENCLDNTVQNTFGALGLCEGSVADIIVACDIAEKAASVTLLDIQGNCPQHMVCLGIIGTVADVKTAMNAIEKQLSENKKHI